MRIKCYFLYDKDTCRVFNIKYVKYNVIPNISKEFGVKVRFCHIADKNILLITDEWDKLPNSPNQMIPNKYKRISRLMLTSHRLSEAKDISERLNIVKEFNKMYMQRTR